MNLSEHEKAIIAIEALASQIGQRGEELDDQVLLNIASDLQLFMVSALHGDLNDFLDYVNSFREKKIKEAEEFLEDLVMENLTGKKITDSKKVLRREQLREN